MTYKVKVEKNVIKYIKKQGVVVEKAFKRKFDELKMSKIGYRKLDQFGTTELWELRCQAHRVYYTVEDKFIVIENIEYEGDISIVRGGNKNTQNKDIKHLKNKIKKGVGCAL